MSETYADNLYVAQNIGCYTTSHILIPELLHIILIYDAYD